MPSEEIMEGLFRRFVLDSPPFRRFLALVEEAHRCYEEDLVVQDPTLSPLPFREFARIMFHSCEPLVPYVAYVHKIVDDFEAYKSQIPVVGAVILNQNLKKCLLVKCSRSGRWSFPLGKRGYDEHDHQCAIREVLEKTGFDISGLLDLQDYIEVTIGEERVRFYVIFGVKEAALSTLQTQQKNKISWQRIEELQPAGISPTSCGVNGLKYYMVAPCVKSLEAWITAHRHSLVWQLYPSVRGLQDLFLALVNIVFNLLKLLRLRQHNQGM